MTEQKRHDSLAPKGAFASKDAGEAELASAQTANLIASDTPVDDNDAPEITAADHAVLGGASDDGLCADELLPAESDRVSTEDAMRALIAMRLERTRPSDDFGAFEFGADRARNDSGHSGLATIAGASRTDTLHSLAPIELAPAAASKVTVTEGKKLTPFPFLAAAAVLLLAVGFYRRANQEAPTAPQAAAQLTEAESVALPVAEAPVAEQQAEMDVLDVSESEDAILTLGTPTIINVAAEADALDEAEPTIGPATRAIQETATKKRSSAAVVAKATASTTTVALPVAPSREAIVTGFNSVRDAVLSCANGSGGVAPIEATIVGDGRITHATVGGYYQGTPEGSCIARALRKAHFAPFSGDSIKVAFPYTL